VTRRKKEINTYKDTCIS